ncbi:quercetin dioxygenase-like cupin family protein [Natronocella acetinitrilica]|uniref:Quercetin dioxygenase-like cupin family protein n=1 Tax=Natronocella acetinitrilica TaxID=414046 RepID=A0AAE3G4K8_9GAMM|nr:quercetin dioxygenase-like cupin family protein [Natronocella acetinitrilica]
MLVKTALEREWNDTGHPGVERSLFRNNPEGGRSSVVRLAANSRVPRHRHEGSEEVLVLLGQVEIGGARLNEGDYLYTEVGEEHDVVAVTDAIIFVSSTKATPMVE